ncbi:plasmid replication DNA-binding protein KfrA [Pseudoduganella lurida]|uniref:Plasmid replication DNA-binding protein KfrA n=1 Tax=Pseudoduganella lurida TaxID=1036180 RepID=A0A562RL14_9BURK|nr:DNA-binding protein [Pseudoduganella lurida]TWI69711.1 plasmid replication DNA-binding protein KfrA [Pseudoduganella lurida]
MQDQTPTFDAVSSAATGLQERGQPVTIEAVREALGSGSPNLIQKHLSAWRATQDAPAPAPKAELPAAVVAALADWAQQFAEQSGAGARDALAQSESDMAALAEAGEALEAERDALLAELSAANVLAAERAEQIERLTVELRDAREVATNALVGKAKDQLAIDGKDRQIADLRSQLERSVTSAGTDSDARLAAEMELVGAVTARDNFASEVKALREQLDAATAERRALRVEIDGLKGRR